MIPAGSHLDSDVFIPDRSLLEKRQTVNNGVCLCSPGAACRDQVSFLKGPKTEPYFSGTRRRVSVPCGPSPALEQRGRYWESLWS